MSNATDPRALTTMEAELLKNLADTIVEPEVMKPMDKIGWSHADPTLVDLTEPDNPVTVEQTAEVTPKPDAPVVDNPPQPTADAPTATTASAVDEIDWESLRGSNGLILDKYTNKAEAVKGVGHAVAMAKNAFTRAAVLEKENAELKSRAYTSPPSTPVNAPPPVQSLRPVDNAELQKVLDEIIEEGGTLDAANGIKLREAIASQTESVAARAVEEALRVKDARVAQENAKWVAVDAYMRDRHPESVKFTDEMSLYVESDPLTKSAVSSLISLGKETEAAELAWIKYKIARDAKVAAVQTVQDQTKEIVLTAADDVRKEAVAQARIDAGVITTMAGGVHESPNVGPSQEEIDNAGAEMLRTGLGERWRALTIGKDLKGPLFD